MSTLAVLGAIAGCGARTAPDDADRIDGSTECEDETWGRYEWIVDGVRGQSGCFAASSYGQTAATPGPSSPALAIALGQTGTLEEVVWMPLPFCSGQLYTANIAMRTGATGAVSATPDSDGTSSAFFVRVHAITTTSDRHHCVEGGDTLATPGSGRWSILQGGTWGEMIDVEIADVTFEPIEGHELVIPYGRWRARLPDTPIRYP